MSWKTMAIVTVGVAALAAAACGGAGGERAAAPAAEAPEVTAHGGAAVAWERSWDAALERARREDKPVLVDFYADWCVWCRTLDTTTFRDEEVRAFLGREVIPVKLNVDAEGASLARRWGVDGLPTILLLNPDGRELGRIPGYLPADRFLREVRRLTGSGGRRS